MVSKRFDSWLCCEILFIESLFHCMYGLGASAYPCLCSVLNFPCTRLIPGQGGPTIALVFFYVILQKLVLAIEEDKPREKNKQIKKEFSQMQQ